MVIVFTGSNYAGYEALRTSCSAYDLFFDVLACNPQVQKRFIEIYKKEIETPSDNPNEIMILAHILDKMGEFNKVLDYLNIYGNKYNDDKKFNYLKGKAYYETGNIVKAKMYLNTCMRISNEQELPKEGYFNLAKTILDNIQLNGM